MSKFDLDNTKFYPIYLFFKFSTKDRLKEIQKKGYIYMKNLQYFVNQEKQTMIKGQGDRYEARMFSTSAIKIYDNETNELVAHSRSGIIQDSRSLKSPVFCLTAKNIVENIIDYDHPKFISEVKFDDRMISDFSKNDYESYVLIIHNVNEFISRFKKTVLAKDLNFKKRLVKYRDTSVLHKNGNDIDINTAFHKDDYFSYQDEYRFLVDKEVEDYFELEIGSIEDISIIKKTEDIIKGLRIEGKAGEPVEI